METEWPPRQSYEAEWDMRWSMEAVLHPRHSKEIYQGGWARRWSSGQSQAGRQSDIAGEAKWQRSVQNQVGRQCNAWRGVRYCGETQGTAMRQRVEDGSGWIGSALYKNFPLHHLGFHLLSVLFPSLGYLSCDLENFWCIYQFRGLAVYHVR